MKISKKIEQSSKDGKVWWSFEYFPPRTAQVRVHPLLRLAVVSTNLFI
jgi:5,10-methylenetetrahydrofolate reductase